MADITMIPINQIRNHPDNPRKDVGDVTELAESIKGNGILQNLTVVPIACVPKLTGRKYLEESSEDNDLYVVVIGHRRLAAATMAGEETVPCIVVNMTPGQQQETMLIENMQRTDLTVYEQAQGFQMMLDMGRSVQTIVSRTGFSEATVRRRLKMAELDQDTLKEVSDRQISLADFDRLARIEDMDTRNRVLREIGTSNFNSSVESAIRKQGITRNLPLLKTEIKRIKGKKIHRSETYGGKYQQIGVRIRISDYTEGTPLIPEDETRKIFYYLDEDWDRLELYVENPRPAPVRRSKEELEREQRIKDAHARANELGEIAYKLRSDFAASLRFTTRNREQMLAGAVTVCALHQVAYVGAVNSKGVLDALGVEDEPWNTRNKRMLEALKAAGNAPVPAIIYAAFNDTPSRTYTEGYQYQFPRHKENVVLDAIYDWLISLGYEMSDDEKALRDGTHPLFDNMDND